MADDRISELDTAPEIIEADLMVVVHAGVTYKIPLSVMKTLVLEALNATGVEFDPTGTSFSGVTVAGALAEVDPAFFALSNKGGSELLNDLGPISGAVQIDLTDGHIVLFETAGNVAFTLTGANGGKGSAMVCKFTLGNNGDTIDWTGLGVEWMTSYDPGDPPDYALVAGAFHSILLESEDGFTTSKGYHLTPEPTVYTIPYTLSDLTVANGVRILMNNSGKDRHLVPCGLTLETAPATDAFVADIKKNAQDGGTPASCFTNAGDRPDVAVAGKTGISALPDLGLWADGTGIRIDVITNTGTVAHGMTMDINYTQES